MLISKRYSASRRTTRFISVRFNALNGEWEIRMGNPAILYSNSKFENVEYWANRWGYENGLPIKYVAPASYVEDSFPLKEVGDE